MSSLPLPAKRKGFAFSKGEAETGVRKVDKTEASQPAAAAPQQGPAEYVVSVNGEDVFMAFEGNMVTSTARSIALVSSLRPVVDPLSR